MIHRYKLTLEIAAPYLTKGNLVGLFGIDAPLARLPDDKLYLPGTLIIGKLAEACRHFVDAGAQRYADDLITIFAHENVGENTGRTAREGRRRIFISDLICETNESSDSTARARIAIDPLMGSVTQGALQIIEQPFHPRAKVKFVGELRLLAPAGGADAIAMRLNKALAWITQFGADRTIGFGAAIPADLSAPDALSSMDTVENATRLSLRFNFHDMLCVGDLRTSGNTYMSSAVISGGAIKGAIANQILVGLGKSGSLFDAAGCAPRNLKPLAEHFSKLRISHAFPVKKDVQDRPRRVPISWATSGESFVDHALLANPAQPVLDEKGEVPIFAPDWKPRIWDMANEKVGWSQPDTDLRLRTQIDAKSRSAQEDRLFAIGYRRNDTHDWIAEVDFDGSDVDREAVFTGLQEALSTGLIGIGRGGAFASVASAEAILPIPPTTAKITLTLQTPALLRCPEPGVTGDVTDAYQAGFTALGITAPLTAVFVREQMRGAAFMAKRLTNQASYRPWLLTEPGSVFVFDNASDADIALFTAWKTKGLPLPQTTLTFYGLAATDDLWRQCPYLPENGYGEVAFGPTAGVGAPTDFEEIEGILA